MAAFMARPDLRHPFEEKPIHDAGSATVLYQGKSVTLATLGPGDGLLIQPADLERVNGFAVKPEGACYESLCIPLTGDLLVEAGGQEWLDLEAFAAHVGQPFVKDEAARVWSFAEIPAQRDSTMLNAQVPDIEIKDRKGNLIRFADLKGKKALIVTWSSW